MVSGASQPYQPPGSQLPLHAGPFPRAHPITQDTQTRDLLAYIFSPPEPARLVLTPGSLSPVFYRSDLPQTLTQSAHLNGSRPAGQNPAAYNEWGPLGYRLAEDNFRIEYVPQSYTHLTHRAFGTMRFTIHKIGRISLSMITFHIHNVLCWLGG